MILFGNFLNAMAEILSILISFFIFLFVARAVLSWVNPDPRNVIVQFISNTTDPILARIRSKIPPLGMLDLSVFVAILLLIFIDKFVVASMKLYAMELLRSSVRTVGI
ncbi:MAG: YggT family protein [Deltaproteobacteria bacterium]|nr:YggT family protein [Deltaproteobacteria bacterium]